MTVLVFRRKITPSLSSLLLSLDSYLGLRRLSLPRNEEHVLLDALFHLRPRPPREERLRPHVEVLNLVDALHEGDAQGLGQQQCYST